MGECVWEEEQSGEPREERGGNSSQLTNWEEGTPSLPPPSRTRTAHVTPVLESEEGLSRGFCGYWMPQFGVASTQGLISWA